MHVAIVFVQVMQKHVVFFSPVISIATILESPVSFANVLRWWLWGHVVAGKIAGRIQKAQMPKEGVYHSWYHNWKCGNLHFFAEDGSDPDLSSQFKALKIVKVSILCTVPVVVSWNPWCPGKSGSMFSSLRRASLFVSRGFRCRCRSLAFTNLLRSIGTSFSRRGWNYIHPMAFISLWVLIYIKVYRHTKYIAYNMHSYAFMYCPCVTFV